MSQRCCDSVLFASTGYNLYCQLPTNATQMAAGDGCSDPHLGPFKRIDLPFAALERCPHVAHCFSVWEVSGDSGVLILGAAGDDPGVNKGEVDDTRTQSHRNLDSLFYDGRAHYKINDNNEPIITIQIQNNCALMLTADGVITKITPHPRMQSERVPQFCHAGNDRLVALSAGAKITVAVSETGKIYNGTEAIEIDKSIGDVQSVVTGREHCLLLNKAGEVYSFGCGSRGQLGLENLESHLIPQLVAALAGLKVTAIAANGWHSCALTDSGDIYIWGWNSNGQLGLGSDISIVATPHVLDLGEHNVKQMACGSRHTIILLDNNEIWGCGWNKYQQLKMDQTSENIYQMERLCCFDDYEVTKISCSDWNSMVLARHL